jgi:hypothetical protein
MKPVILILSQYPDEHVSLVTKRLISPHTQHVWLDPGDFPAKHEISLEYDPCGLVRSVLRSRQCEVDLSTIRVIWERRPSKTRASPLVKEESLREWVENESRMFLAGLWDSLDCAWVPGKPRDMRTANEKIYQLALAARLGFRIPRTRVTNRPKDFIEAYNTFDRMVSKVIGNHLVKSEGEYFFGYTHAVRRRDAANHGSIELAPSLFQEYVPKALELRITVVGSLVFAAEIHSQATRATRDDWRHYDLDRIPYAPHTLPGHIETLCVTLVHALGLCFGAIDMILTPSGEYVFLEINPNGLWNWVESKTGLPIADAIAGLLAGKAAAVGKGELAGNVT